MRACITVVRTQQSVAVLSFTCVATDLTDLAAVAAYLADGNFSCFGVGGKVSSLADLYQSMLCQHVQFA